VQVWGAHVCAFACTCTCTYVCRFNVEGKGINIVISLWRLGINTKGIKEIIFISAHEGVGFAFLHTICTANIKLLIIVKTNNCLDLVTEKNIKENVNLFL
jgi:hypothetical protein